MFVLDASVTLAHALSEPNFREDAQRIFAAFATETALVPAIWNLEVASVLLNGEREGKVTKKEVEEVLSRWRNLPVKTETLGLAATFTETLGLARKHNISVYEASYLELAVRQKAPLASFDGALREAAKRQGVALFDGPGSQ